MIIKRFVILIFIIAERKPLWLLYMLLLCGSVGVFAVGSHLYSQSRSKAKDELVSEYAKRRIPKELDVKPQKDEEALMGVRRLPKPPPKEVVEERAEPRIAPGGESPPASGGILAWAFRKAMEKVFINDIRKILESNQSENAKGFKKMEDSGKALWSNTNFIFVLDCSGSMKGTRWNSVIAGVSSCLQKIKGMSSNYISIFTFDNEANPFVKEVTPLEAMKKCGEIPFTGKGTNYKAALDYAVKLIRASDYPSNLTCIIFLSDGFGGVPDDSIEVIKDLRTQGKKILFYSIACDTEDEDDMISMSNELEGEHYRVTDPNASRIIFSMILGI